MVLSQMFIKAGGCSEHRVATPRGTVDRFAKPRLGLCMYVSQMSQHFVFTHFRLECISQIQTTATVPQDRLRVMLFLMSHQIFARFICGSIIFGMRVMHAAELVFFISIMNGVSTPGY